MTNPNPENQETPLVSIIVPYFNREMFLAEAIESVIAQTFENWELLLVNDGSTDKSLEIAQKFKERYPSKIRLFGHQDNENKGASASRNLGIANARGKYITFLDSDDVLFADTLERELKAFENNPQADAVCGTAECWYSWSPEADRWEKDFTIDLVLETEKLYQPPDLHLHNLTAGGRKAHTNCMMLKSDFIRKIGAFEEDYRHIGEDQVFWAKLTLNGRVYVMDAVLARYRLHSASICAIEMENGQDINAMDVFLDWLEIYLREQKIENPDVWNSLRNFRRKIGLETKLGRLKQIYRRFLPLHVRYKIRDKITKTKLRLSGAAHRQK